MSFRRILFASGSANLGGLQSSTHARIMGLRELQIECEKLFLKSGAGRATYAGIPLHITQAKSRLVSLVRDGNFDAVSMINRTDLLPILRDVRYEGRVLYEVRGKAKHGLKCLARLRRGQVGALIVISSYVRSLVYKHLTDRTIPIHVIYNAVDTNLFRPTSEIDTTFLPASSQSDGRPVILWVGRLSRNKNYVEMLRIANILQRREPRPVFWVVSDTHAKDNREEFWKLTRQFNLEKVVHLLECVPHRRMVDIYNHVRISGGCVLSTSISEGFQNSLLEGMACGVPVVSSPAGGNVEMIRDGVHGRIYPLGDPEAAAEALWQLMTETKMRTAFTRAALQLVERRHTPRIHAEAFLQVLSETPVTSFRRQSVTRTVKR